MPVIYSQPKGLIDVTANWTIFHLLCKTLDDHKCNLVDGIFLDFSSAFDKVDHNLLLTKLHSLGIRGFLLQWIQDFLSQRKQRVVFKGAVSDWCSVTSGVPQGSVLGPIFFVLFVNDINDVISSPLFQFADDHTMLRPILSERDHVALQNDIHNIFQWTLCNKLPLNLSKCSVMHMTRSKSPNYCDTYIMGDGTLVEVDEFKLLGVTFSKDLSFDSHIDAISNKVSKLSGFITRCTSGMSSYALLNLYKALILPHIICCACVWAPHQRNHLDRLEKVQRKITRTLFYKEFPNADVRPPYSNRLIDLDIVRVEDALKIQRLILGFKILNDLAPASFGSYIQHSRLVNTRLLHQASRTSSFFNSMFISLPRLWDEIPSDLHIVSNLSSFKLGCKSHYLSMLS